MTIKQWDQKLSVAQVSLALKTYGLMVDKIHNKNILADLTASWDRNGNKYLLCICNEIDKKLVDSSHFQSTLSYCRVNGLKFVVISWSIDSALLEYVLDERDQSKSGFKIIDYGRLSDLKNEYLQRTIKSAAKQR